MTISCHRICGMKATYIYAFTSRYHVALDASAMSLWRPKTDVISSHLSNKVINGETTADDALDEWPAPKEIRSFYLCRFRSYEEPKRKAKIEQAEKDLQKKNQTRFQIIESLKAKRSGRAYVISHLKPLTGELKHYRMVIDEMRKEMEPPTTDLSKLHNVNGTGREKGVSLCSSVEELDDLVSVL